MDRRISTFYPVYNKAHLSKLVRKGIRSERLNDRVPAFDIDEGVEQQENWAF